MAVDKIEGLTLPPIGDKPGGLFFYQLDCLNKLLDGEKRFLFLNHSTGCGKTISACAIMQELVNRDEVDLILFFTLKKMKVNVQRMIQRFTQINALNIDGAKPKRIREFAAAPHQSAVVLNYEKCNFDFDSLAKLVQGKRVLFIMDEVQKILIHTKGKPNKSGSGMKKLVKLAHKDSYIVPMSATTINNNPERYFHLFAYVPEGNPLKNITTFRKNFSSGTKVTYSPWGSKTEYVWDLQKLENVRSLVEPYTHTVRKTDPGVRELFKDTAMVPIYVQLSDEDRDLYDFILEAAEEDDEELFGQYYRVLRYLCNTAGSLKFSKSAVAQTIVEAMPDLSSKTSSKMEVLIDLVTTIRDQDDKVVIFTEYTNLGLFLIAEELRAAGINIVTHYGSGMTDKEAQKAQDDFKQDPSITVFLSSNAGSHGLSFQEARYVINYEPTFSYDLMMQRNDRIDRADSYLDGLTAYVLICEDTVEERLWRINNDRRMMAAATQGTIEEYGRSSEAESVKELMFG